jgi:hypothetical protein
VTPKVLQPEELKNYWRDIKPGLEKVLLNTPTASWIPEDVYSAIQNRKAICVLGIEEEEVVGFFVGYPQANSFFAWAVWSQGDLSEGINHLLWYAKEVGCRKVIFQSDRKGWARVLRKYNAYPHTWVMEV